jgi:hypothetical protein
MAVTGLAEMDFWAYWPNQKPVHLRVARDELYIQRLIATEREIWIQIEERSK